MQARPIRNPRELGRVIHAGAAPSGRHVKGTPVRWGRLGTTYALGWPEGVHAGQERLGLLGSHMRIFRSMAGPGCLLQTQLVSSHTKHTAGSAF